MNRVKVDEFFVHRCTSHVILKQFKQSSVSSFMFWKILTLVYIYWAVIQNRAFLISFSVERMVMYRYLRLIDQVMPFLLPESKFTTHINLIIFPTVPQDYYNTYYPKIFKNCSVSGMLVKYANLQTFFFHCIINI